MIKVFNSAYKNDDHKMIPLTEVSVCEQAMDYRGHPYIMFEHKDYPLGALRAEFDSKEALWLCDLN